MLDRNLRNTKQIVEAIRPFAKHVKSRGLDGPDVRFVAAPDQVISTADDQIDLLLDEGWAPGDLALVTTQKRHPVQFDLVEQHGNEGYWASYFAGRSRADDEGEVFYATALGFKGLESKVVVLAVNDTHDEQRARERLYVGMSRATDLLVVVADPDQLRASGGDELARKLGLN